MVFYNKNLVLVVIFSMIIPLRANAQLEALSDANIPCDKVYAVHGEIAIGADYGMFDYDNLMLFDIGTGAVVSSFNMKVKKAYEHGGNHYFLLFDDFAPGQGTLYLFEDGQLLPAAYDQALYDIYFEPELDALVGVTPEGFALIHGGELLVEVILGERLLNLQVHGDGFIGVSKNAYHLLNSELVTVETYSFPEGFESFTGAAAGNVLLLSPPADLISERTLALYNVDSQDLYPVLNAEGEEVSINYYLLPQGIFEDHFFLTGSGQVESAQFTFTHPTDVGFINISTGLYTEANARLGLWKGVVQPVVIESANGPLIFGRMGIEGIEPYAIRGQQIAAVKDIYEGFGGSINLLVQSTLGYIDPLTRPASFELIEKNGIIYFSARSKYLGHQVWQTDGTEEGTFAITQFNVANKGFDKCFFSKDSDGILITILHRGGMRRLYRPVPNLVQVASEVDSERNWEVLYATHPTVESGVRYMDLEHPGVHLAKDGTSVLVLSRMDLWVDHMSFNHKWILPSNKIQGFNANTGIQVINADGSLKSSALIRAREDQPRMIGRSYTTGNVYVVISHRPADTFVNGNRLEEPREGHYLIELDGHGQVVKTTFLATGSKDRIRFSQMKITDEGIYMLGMADRAFNFNGANFNTIAQGNLRATVIKFNKDHSFQWIADSGLDQDIFGQGLHNLVVDEESVYMATGGTSYNVWSSCAFSEWPYQISRLDKETGNRDWRRLLHANDVTRITSMKILGKKWLWIGGYTRGDLLTSERDLDLVPNFVTCTYNDFLLCFNVESGVSSYLAHTDASRPKFIQDIQFHDDHLYTLSLTYEEELFPLPIYESLNGRWNLQVDKFTNGGLKVDSLIWPTSIYRTNIGDRLEDHKFSFDFHPDGGIVLSGQRIRNGMIDGFASPSSEARWTYMNSWLLQRRDIETLENAVLPLAQNKDGGDFDIYPNPLDGSTFVLRIPPEDLGKYDRLSLTDIQGRRIMQQNLNSTFESNFVDLDGAIANGVYIVELAGTSQSAAKKLVIRR